MLTIRPERLEDRDDIDQVVCAAFGQRGEADLVNLLRDADALALSLVAETAGGLVGHLAFSPVTISHNPERALALALAPLSVAPQSQRQGIGRRLVEQGLADAAAAGWDLVFVLGDPQYYRRFAFAPAAEHDLRWDREAPDGAFMVLALNSAAWLRAEGVVRLHEAFDRI